MESRSADIVGKSDAIVEWVVAKIEMVHVPYKGMGPATMDLIAGQLQLVFADLPVLLQQVKAE